MEKQHYSQFLNSVVENVFPVGSQLVRDPKEVPPEQRYYVLSAKQGTPRWLLPYNPKLAASSLSNWAPYDFSSKLKWQIAQWLYRNRSLGLLPKLQCIGIHSPVSGWKGLPEQQAEPFDQAVFYLGSPSNRCKAVAFLRGKQKEHLAVAKFPIGSCAAAKIHREAQLLSSLPSKEKLAPQLLFENQSLGVSLQSVISGQQVPWDFTQAQLNWLIQLRNIQNASTTLSAHLQLLRKRFETQALTEAKQLFLKDILARLEDDTPLPSFITHGDFAAWNLKKRSDGHLMAVDWEEGQVNGLPLTDLVYYGFIQRFVKQIPFNLQAFLQTKHVLDYCNELEITEALKQKLTGYFLLDYWARRLEENEIDLAKLIFRYIEPLLKEGVCTS